MKSIVIYVPGGRIVRHGVYCPPADPMQGELQIDGEVSGISSQYVDEQSDPPVIVNMPLRPSMAHDFDYATKQWVLNVDEAWRRVRQRRGNLLSACDWTQLPDVSAETRSKWAAYRQQLRDITAQPDPLSITWPAEPS